MAMPVSGVPTETPASQAAELGSGRGLGRIGRAVRLSRKATIGAVILGINFAPVPNALTATIVLGVIAVVALGLFVVRQRRARRTDYRMMLQLEIGVSRRP